MQSIDGPMRALLHKVGSAHTDINIRIVFTIMIIKECQYLLEHDQGLSGLDERAKAAALVILYYQSRQAVGGQYHRMKLPG